MMVSMIDAKHAGPLVFAFLVSWASSFMILFISKDSMDVKLFRHIHFSLSLIGLCNYAPLEEILYFLILFFQLNT